MALLDRQKVEVVLTRRFPGARCDQVAAATNAIMGLSDEWEEVFPRSRRWGWSLGFAELHCLARDAVDGGEFRLFRRRGSRGSVRPPSDVRGTLDSEV